jgi:hypothetical protein
VATSSASPRPVKRWRSVVFRIVATLAVLVPLAGIYPMFAPFGVATEAATALQQDLASGGWTLDVDLAEGEQLVAAAREAAQIEWIGPDRGPSVFDSGTPEDVLATVKDAIASSTPRRARCPAPSPPSAARRAGRRPAPRAAAARAA